MNEDEINAIDKRLADMSARCDAVIEKESRGKPMPVLDFKPRSRPMSAIASNSQQRHRGSYRPPDPDEELRQEYVERVSFANAEWKREKTEFDQIWADFERQFDEMAQAHRQRA